MKINVEIDSRGEKIVNVTIGIFEAVIWIELLAIGFIFLRLED